MDIFAEFLSKIDNPDHQDRMEEILKWVNETFSKLEPVVKWNQPMFTDHGTFIIGFSVAKNHLSVAPEEVVIERFSDEIKEAGYDHTKGLFKIKHSQSIDYTLLEKMIAFNIEDKKDCSTFWRK